MTLSTDSVKPNTAIKKARSSQTPPPVEIPPFDGKLTFDREMSWLEFNRRVLEEATDDSLPVLERLKFLSIFSSNLDEFFMIRVSGIKEQIAEGVGELTADGLTASEQLQQITKQLRPMLKRQVTYLNENVLPALEKAGITIEPYSSLNAKEKKKIDKYFRDNLFPILTPQSVDSSHPFPYISNLSLNLGMYIEPNRQSIQPNLRYLFKQKRFTRIKLPSSVSRLVPITDKGKRFTLLEQVIAANASEIFPQMKVSEAFLFRVTRDADIELREDEAGDLMRTLEVELQRRRDRFAVRLEVASAMPEKMVKLLTTGVGLTDTDVERIDGFIDISDLMRLYSLDVPSLKERPITAVASPLIPNPQDIFDAIKRQDILLHHPFMPFATVTDLLAQAATDHDVQAIKICLYRTGKDSPIVDWLIRAVRQGKQVTALVELKARFDEENNIEWARRLENEGVHVVYGISSLKTHSKVLLVVRREKDKLKRYVHLATGNYNPVTSRSYTDLGLLTCDEQIGADATNLFNFLTGYSQQDHFDRLLVAPLHLRDRLIEMIRREKRNKLAGKDARIIIKVNSVTDTTLVNELYEASKAGVDIDLIVRGVCTLRPGIAGLSETIKVRSIVGRFLEHSRVFWFANATGESPETYIGSADLMSRNLDRRVEVLVPIIDPEIREYIRNVFLDAYLRDTANARELKADGTYRRIGSRTAKHFDAQMFFVGKPAGI